MTPAPGSLALICPAKLNLSLAVGPPQPTPRGTLHPIGSWMATLAFHDQLILSHPEPPPPGRVPASPQPGHAAPQRGRLQLQRQLADDAPQTFSIDWPLDQDLAVQAHRLIEQTVGRPLPTHARLIKRIPPGAGLGGGSANAAAMIAGLNRLHQLDLSPPQQQDLARRLGSDVVFALATLSHPAGVADQFDAEDAGSDRSPPTTPTSITSAWVEGFGDRLRPLTPSPRRHLALILPPFTCPTAAVYHAFDQLRPDQATADAEDRSDLSFDQKLADLRDAALRGDLRDSAFPNDLEPAAVAVQPRLASLLHQLRVDLNLPAQLTGSGAACFVLCRDAQHAGETARRVGKHTPAAALATQLR